MKCPHCQAENPEKVKYCGECGRLMATDLICPKCGYKNIQGTKFCHECGQALGSATLAPAPSTAAPPPPAQPTSFANGRYQVKKFLGEGGKKKVFLAHDALLDRDVAFALIKTEKLDEIALTRIKREAQAMGRLGDHPNIVSIYDLGDHQGQPFIVLPLMGGGDVEGLIKKAPEHKLPLDQAISIAQAVCRGLVFAHTKGIIHRDIKPGNVWLSADGTAKIGDFGLAVALDLSRLTQHGMMVGTVSYMPPEQAMGGEVTAKADLYSLGALLYEMVTGRPPFVGDDSVAIIGQHINTPPVSPAWHRADLSPVLETLILQLLEKDPAKRPASAAEVLKVLESLDTAKVKTAAQPESTVSATNSPLYRRVFIGREAELKQLQSAFDGAMSGQGALMMVVGEPGIGKTATCEQLATYVALRGGKTLVGHCYEKGSLSLPYLGFVEALRGYVINRDSQELRKELGTGAADVARIVSEIREKLKVKPKAQGDPDEEKYRLMQAVTGFLTNAAGVHPLMIVLEDLHDADKGTIDMLTHVSRNLSGTRLLIVGTYRDVEVDRNHPLSAALAELRRISNFGRVLLRGLNADEVSRMLKSIAEQEVPWGLAEAVHRQTEGNPLFVQEVVRYLNEEGLIKRDGGQWKGKSGTTLLMSIPEGLRDVIGKRLSLLTNECNQLLTMASVIGREFALETLRSIAGMKEEVFVNALKEAIRLSILEERSQVGIIRYRFTHAFLRQTLYEEMIAPQRLNLHQQVARSLETQYVGRLEDHAVELAEHFSQSTDHADLTRAVAYSEMAAKRASDVYAYGEAARLLEQALKVQRVLDPANLEKLAALLLNLADATSLAGDPRGALDKPLPEAFNLSVAAGDARLASACCTQAIMSLIFLGAGSTVSWSTSEALEWVERSDRFAAPDTVDRVWADIALGERLYFLQEQSLGWKVESIELFSRALNLARRLGDPEAYWFAACAWLRNVSLTRYFEQKLSLINELESHSRSGVSHRTLVTTLFLLFHALLEIGQREQAENLFKEIKNLVEQSGQANLRAQVLTIEGVAAALDGHLAEALERADLLVNEGTKLGIPEYAKILHLLVKTRPMLYLGRAEEALAPVNIGNYFNPYAILCLAHLQRRSEVAEELKELVLSPTSDHSEYATAITVEVSLMEAAVLSLNLQAADILLSRLTDCKFRTTGIYLNTCIARHMGGAAALLGRRDEARLYYREAVKLCTEMRIRPELALTRLQLAELLLEHYPDEKKEAMEHLDFAIQEFREMKMQPSLERALRQKKILKA